MLDCKKSVLVTEVYGRVLVTDVVRGEANRPSILPGRSKATNTGTTHEKMIANICKALRSCERFNVAILHAVRQQQRNAAASYLLTSLTIRKSINKAVAPSTAF